jgi:hypothetical protein
MAHEPKEIGLPRADIQRVRGRLGSDHRGVDGDDLATRPARRAAPRARCRRGDTGDRRRHDQRPLRSCDRAPRMRWARAARMDRMSTARRPPLTLGRVPVPAEALRARRLQAGVISDGQATSRPRSPEAPTRPDYRIWEPPLVFHRNILHIIRSSTETGLNLLRPSGVPSCRAP